MDFSGDVRIGITCVLTLTFSSDQQHETEVTASELSSKHNMLLGVALENPDHP